MNQPGLRVSRVVRLTDCPAATKVRGSRNNAASEGIQGYDVGCCMVIQWSVTMPIPHREALFKRADDDHFVRQVRFYRLLAFLLRDERDALQIHPGNADHVH
jgi:hypothetical protein